MFGFTFLLVCRSDSDSDKELEAAVKLSLELTNVSGSIDDEKYTNVFEGVGVER